MSHFTVPLTQHVAMKKISEDREKELVKTCPIASQEIRRGGCEKLKELIKAHDDYIGYVLECTSLVQRAIEKNNVKALKVFLDAGVHPDSTSHVNGDTLLRTAISDCAHKSAECLLDAGADVNYRNDGIVPSPLVSAAYQGDLKMVKLLLERGADLHYIYDYGREEKSNALREAVIHGRQEVADYLRSLGAVMLEDERFPIYSPEEQILASQKRFFKGKPLKFVITDVTPASVPLKVYIFPPVKNKRANTLFVTGGLVEYGLTLPKHKEYLCYAEYFIEMPGTWPVKEKDLEQDEYFWPIRWLKAIARYPHEHVGYYFGKKTIVDTKMIPSLTTPDGKHDSALVERCADLSCRISQELRFVNHYRIAPMCSGESGK